MEYNNTEEEEAGDRGVVHPGHPAIIESLLIKSGEGKLKAGTILKGGDPAGLVRAAASDQGDAVLVQDIDVSSEAKPARCLRHGLVIRSRLINASGAEPIPASDTLANKLPSRGIYITQGWDSSIQG